MTDVPQGVIDFLEQHTNMDGRIRLDMPQMRAWQIFEYDGTRHEIYRTDRDDVIELFFSRTYKMEEIQPASWKDCSIVLFYPVISNSIREWADCFIR